MRAAEFITKTSLTKLSRADLSEGLTTEKQILTRIRQIMYDRKLSGTDSNAGELLRLKQQLKDLRGSQGVAEEAAGVGIVTKQNATADVPVGGEYMNVKKLFPKKKKQDVAETELDEDLRKWFKDKWVRFGPDGKIRGDCARGSEKEGKPKCLPKSKAQSLGKDGRAAAAARKRRQDPDADRKGKAINVKTK